MPFGFWVLGNQTTRPSSSTAQTGRLKCLSAFGFWGTKRKQRRSGSAGGGSQMPFGFWVLGDCAMPSCIPPWGLHCLKCLSAFGFWGTVASANREGFTINLSQMPFGFWVLGDQSEILLKPPALSRVSNAFRLLGSGGHPMLDRKDWSFDKVSNAFRLLGSGGPVEKHRDHLHKKYGSQMPFGFWVLGDSLPQKSRRPLWLSRLKCLSAFGFWGTPSIQAQPTPPSFSLKCLSAFGFWGTHQHL